MGQLDGTFFDGKFLDSDFFDGELFDGKFFAGKFLDRAAGRWDRPDRPRPRSAP